MLLCVNSVLVCVVVWRALSLEELKVNGKQSVRGLRQISFNLLPFFSLSLLQSSDVQDGQMHQIVSCNGNSFTILTKSRGCQQEFDPSSNQTSACVFHPGGPIFHEGSKSYSCCNTVNKPVLSFEEFLAIPGCATGSHTAEAAFVAPVLSEAQEKAKAAAGPGPAPIKKEPVQAVKKETAQLPQRPAHHFQKQNQENRTENIKQSTPFPVKAEIEQDAEDAVASSGAKCLRAGCQTTFGSDLKRCDDECAFHPGSAIFHEGSKGYSCCRPRVLEFDQFLAIQGCTKNRHLFVGQPKVAVSDEIVEARIDFYQTPQTVIVSIFAKGADKSKSNVAFDHWELDYNLLLPASKKASRIVPLFGPIDPEKSTFKVLSTKTEVILAKADGRSWPTLEFDADAANRNLPNVTFGVGGKTGTVGGKVLSEAHNVPVYA